MPGPTVARLIETWRTHATNAYERACSDLGAVLTRRVARLKEQRAEYTPGSFPPAWKMRQWEEDEALTRAVAALTDHADERIRLERKAAALLAHRTDTLLESTDAGIPVLLKSNDYLLRRAVKAEDENCRLWLENAAESEKAIEWMQQVLDLRQELRKLKLALNDAVNA